MLYSIVRTIQVVIDESLLQAADEAAGRLKVNRSSLFRDALRVYLKRAEVLEQENQDRMGYQRIPDIEEDLTWTLEAAWPDD